MSERKKPRFVPCYFGPLPAGAINNALDMDIAPGDVVMSVRAQKHARRSHPKDYARWRFPHVATVVTTPLYARDDFKNDGKIELVEAPRLADYLLVAVEVACDAEGRYNVTSFYPLSDKKVEGRRESGDLRRIVLI